MCLFLGVLCPGISHGAGPPPVITVQPSDTNVQKTAVATFSVTATSGTSLSYQWYFGSNTISSGTGSTLTRTNVMPGDAGLYYVAVKNSGGTVNSRQATLAVLNTAPVANDDVYNLTALLPLSVAPPGVLANDTDINHDALSAVLVSSVSHGSLSFNSDGSFTYTPDPLYSGSDSFTYQASDGTSLGNVAAVYFNIALLNQPPVAGNQSVVVPNYMSTNLVLKATDPDSPNLIYSIVSAPTNGVLTGLIPSTGAITYTPLSNYFGPDYFTFAAFDGSLYATGQVSVTIQSPPTVSGRNASSIGTSLANLRASVNPRGLATVYWFQYGVTTNYGSLSGTNSLPAGTNSVTVQTPITNLVPGTLYHFCVLAANSVGIVSGPDVTFTTDYLPPLANTLPASNVTPNSLTLNAAVNPQGAPTRYYFQYGVTTNYGSFSATNSLPSGSNSVAVGLGLAGLPPGTVFHYCVVANSVGGTTLGGDVMVTLPMIPPFQCTASTSPGGNMQLFISSLSGASFTVLSSTNLAMPMDNWAVLGSMTEMSGGQYQFTDPQLSTNPQCYYRIRSP